MLNGWICSIDDFCADNLSYYQFKLKGKRRRSVCVAMSCGGDNFSPDGAYDSAWDNVKP